MPMFSTKAPHSAKVFITLHPTLKKQGIR